MRRLVACIIVSLAACSGGSSGPDASTNLCSNVDPSCTPSVTPTFDAIYDAILAPKCATAGCHDAMASRTSLLLHDRQLAYDLLLDDSSGPAVVTPDNADCTPMMQRLESPSFGYQMPPGDPLPAGEICAIYQWIENGAQR